MDAELISYLDAKFGAIDAKFGELRAEIDVRFGELRAEIDARFNEERIERRAEIEKTETNLLRAFHTTGRAPWKSASASRTQRLRDSICALPLLKNASPN